jgi:hypothetical protein
MECTTLPSKKDIIQRLFTAGHITFEEMWVLLQESNDVRYVIMPNSPVIINPILPIQPYQPPLPLTPLDPPWTISCTKSDKHV